MPGPAGAEPWGAVPGQRDVWPTPQQEALLRAALLADERGLAAWRTVRPHLEVARLDAPVQGILPLLRENLAAHDVEDELLPLFKGVHRFTWARNQVLLNRMLPVVAELERAGISTLLLKGAALVVDTRLDAGMRAMNDVDVLVPTGMTAAAIDVLVSAGLRPVGDVPTWYIADYAPRFVPSHGFTDSDNLQLDLHWHVLHASCQPDADEDFWAAAVAVELLGVRTRSLCPADELLLVILHGLRWNAIPTYRWVLDAALLARGVSGPVDYERLLEQARRRRVLAQLAAGLSYLRRVVDAPIPADILRKLRSSGAPRLERLEFRAQMTQPQRRGALQRELVYHGQYLRRELPLGERATLARQIRLGRRRLGIERWRELRSALSGGRPGPGRPASEVAAAIGAGAADPAASPIAFGEPIDLRLPDVARSYGAYGLWRPEGEGCWIAGREARVVLPLPRPARTSLLLELWAEGFLSADCPRQRLEVLANDVPVAEFQIDSSSSLHGEVLVIPRAALAGSDRVELTLRTPDATSPAQLGLDDDDRRVSVLLRRLVLREPYACAVGSRLSLGEGSGDDEALAGGWSHAEPAGRWTHGHQAQLLLRLEGPPVPLDLEFDAVPLLGGGQRTLQVEVTANRQRLASIAYDEEMTYPHLTSVPLPATALGPEGELLLAWRIHDPRSPFALGVSDDRRPLGLFLERAALVPHSNGRSRPPS